ncbi:histidine phosphatase family protein [Peteryoungia ipomoeae]|uniref:Histidine phosphatase family protein n=1 Tax=Peteryoungia ipomoeae TaxID=1210932 RepID=A0A4S8P4T8_9HYPH|nr:histidine phosphatase family protein [Peteryoungia ipomoeae]THV25117.1 histidine phosphatase family protein [Peteryoungia ipomoeae]
MNEIFVITHPQSIHHLEGKVGGWYDTGLTDKGRDQAHAIAKQIADRCAGRLPLVIGSDLKRCKETTEIIARQLERPFDLDRGLRELSYGVAEGQPQSWLDARRQPVPDHGALDDTGGIEGAETRRDIATRVYAAMQRFAQTGDLGIVVTHGFALTFVVAWWIGMPIASTGAVSFPAPSGSITHLRRDPHWKSRAVLSLGEASHLVPR